MSKELDKFYLFLKNYIVDILNKIEALSFKVDDNIKEFEQKDENYLDIIEILCNNIVLEVPLRYTLVSDEELKGYAGEGWKLVSEEELELKNNPFSALQNIEDGSDK